MKRSSPLWPAAAALLSIALAACGSAAPTPAAGSSPAAPAAAAPSSQAAQSASAAPAPASAAAWQRPMDVQPLPEAGIFKVVSQIPAPGDKVPLFFMGAQG